MSMAVRRRRIDLAYRSEALDDLKKLHIVSDPETVARAWSTIFELADVYGLTVYDAAYLDLALRQGAALATVDKKLRAAGAASGLELLGL
jgi:predicted nucleic acid-binding protein